MTYIPTNGENGKLHHVSNRRERMVKVFVTKEEVTDEYERIGIITCKFRDQGKAILTAKNFAARANGDAILFTDANDQTAGQEVARRFFGNSGAFKGKYGFWVYRLKNKPTAVSSI